MDKLDRQEVEQHNTQEHQNPYDEPEPPEEADARAREVAKRSTRNSAFLISQLWQAGEF